MDGTHFGTDGIRDKAGEGRLAPGELVRIGRAVARFAKRRSPNPVVFVGRDPRPSGASILAGLASGLAAEGARVEDGGVLPTPAVAWWATRGRCDVALAVTASHNPPEWNGVKVVLPGGRKSAPEDEAAIEAEIRSSSPTAPAAKPVPVPGAVDEYVAAAIRRLEPLGRLDGVRVVLDCASGATAATAPRVLAALGAVVLGTVGRDPSKPINGGCGTEHPDSWRKETGASKAFGGLAFDGDGDRVLLADERGEVLDGDPVLLLLARDLAERNALPGRVVVSTVMANGGLEEALHRAGLRLERVPVGDRHVAARMRELGASLGGEQSGHVLLDWDGALVGDGLVAGVSALQAARRRDVALSAARAEVARWPQVLVNVRVAKRVPLDEAPAFQAAVRESEARLSGRGRVLVRYSGTEPLLRIMVEGRDASAVDAEVRSLESAARRLIPGGDDVPAPARARTSRSS
jgi:phosphoglucosamine mutase